MSKVFKLPLSVEVSRPESGGDGHCYLLSGRGQFVSTEDMKELKAICRAVNSYDDLITENKRLKACECKPNKQQP